MTASLTEHQKLISGQEALAKCAEMARLITTYIDGKGDGLHATEVKQLGFLRESHTGTTTRGVIDPFITIVVQGRKDVLIGGNHYEYGAAEYLIATVDLPLEGFTVEATKDKPYLSVKVDIDPIYLSETIAEITPGWCQQDDSVNGWYVSDAHILLIDCALRLVQLLATPQDIPFLAPMILRELYYRLLMSKQGEAMRQIATQGSAMHRIAKTIQFMRIHFTEPLPVEQLAQHADMSVASFHRHFKKVTAMSPLQYQKQLRLLSARQLMLTGNLNATQTAYQVGYESLSQFSREYSRMFGEPPVQDVERLRMA